MDIAFLLKGFVIGVSIAAPIGPISMLCIRRTFAEGRIFGIISGLGGSTADAVFGCIAGFGLTFISNIMIDQQAWLRLIGGVFLCYLGIKILYAKPEKRAALSRGNGLVGAYASTFFLTLTNPMTILSFAVVFAGLGLASTGGNYVSAGSLVLGIFVGSASWMLILCSSVDVFRERLDPHRAEVGKHNLRSNYHRIWFGHSPEFRSAIVGYLIVKFFGPIVKLLSIVRCQCMHHTNFYE